MKKHNIIKKLAALALSAVTVLSLAACGAKEQVPEKTDSYKIGICNYVDDASLNQIVDNIRSRLTEVGQEKGADRRQLPG